MEHRWQKYKYLVGCQSRCLRNHMAIIFDRGEKRARDIARFTGASEKRIIEGSRIKGEGELR